jgi:L-lactate dehydrogenase complex protein LldE
MKVQLFIPCFVDQLYPHSAMNMVKVLEKLGCSVSYNENQTCCGQPAFNAGFQDDCKAVGSKFIKDFSGQELIVTPSASCAGFIRNYYPKLFDNSSLHNDVKDLQRRVFEFSEFITGVLKKEDVGATLSGRATYHDSCAALRECGIKSAPRTLLQQVKGLELVEMQDVETCCGFGGTFSVKFESISTAMADQKVQHALATKADYLVSTDLSCLMHMEGYIQKNGFSLKTMHLADVLASGW